MSAPPVRLDDVDRPPSRAVLVVAIVLITAGWAALFLGWWGAGRQELETGQVPYLISGGFGGAGLLVLGAAGVLLYALQRASWRSRQDAIELVDAVRRLTERLEPRPDDERPPRRRPRKSTRKRTRPAS